jgi:hypothetical protein
MNRIWGKDFARRNAKEAKREKGEWNLTAEDAEKGFFRQNLQN